MVHTTIKSEGESKHTHLRCVISFRHFKGMNTTREMNAVRDNKA